MSDEAEEIEELLDAVGPKRVKTKDYEIENHNINDIMRAVERRRSSWPTMASIPYTKVVPKHGCYCPTNQEPGCCSDE
jgi:hypothetical protein